MRLDDTTTAASPTSVRLHAATATLCTVAVAAAALGICGGDGFVGWDWAWLFGATALTAAAARFGRSLSRTGRTDPFEATGPLLLGIYFGNIAVEPVIRLLGGGRPLEILLQAGLAALLPLLAWAATRRRWVVVAGGVSLAVTLFSVCLLSGPAVTLAAAIWAAIVPIWLAVVTDEATEGQRIAERSRSHRRLAIAASAGGILLTASLATMLGGRDSLSLSHGVLASSGGDGMESEYARDGVGDGRHLVPATTMAESFGPIDDAPFAKTDEPSLYDVFDDRYDDSEVIKTKKNDRAVALAPEQVQKQEREMAEAEAAGRAFSTLRSPRNERRGEVGDRLSDALFYVAGRRPLHLRTAVFERFDGVAWHAGEFAERERPELTMDTTGDQPWLMITPSGQPGYRDMHALCSPVEDHAIKPVHIDGPQIPMPPCSTAIHIRDVATETMFVARPGGLVAMDRDRLPKMVPIHIASRRIDRERLTEGGRFYSGPHELHAMPAGPEFGRIAALASEWTAGLDRGWPQIAAIERRLRRHAELDENAVVSDAAVPVASLLFGPEGDRRGPDYLFATAAASMLRSQGYAARLVQGFYVRPEKYDAAGGHTPIHATDLHTWCEVRLAGGAWVTLDPSPGYAVLGPERSLWERIQRAVAALPGLVWRLRAWLIIGGLIAVVLYAARDWLTDRIWTLALRLSGRSRDARSVWRLIDWRIGRVCPRPPGWTPRRRIDSLGLPDEASGRLSRLAEAVGRAAFAPWAVDPDSLRRTCDPPAVLAEVTRQRLRRACGGDAAVMADAASPARTDPPAASRAVATQRTAL